MRLIAKIVRISQAKCHCNGLINVQDIQDYTTKTRVSFLAHIVVA